MNNVIIYDIIVTVCFSISCNFSGNYICAHNVCGYVFTKYIWPIVT